MPLRIEEAIEALQRTPAVLDGLLRGRGDEALSCRERPDAFSPIDVLGHLIFGELTDWIPRARIILECRDSRPFDPFDRRDFGDLIAGKAVEALLDRFRELRERNVAELRGFALDEAALALPGRHPELGPVTMGNLIATWVVHDLGHIAQIVRTLASRYRETVGPWREYLSIVQ